MRETNVPSPSKVPTVKDVALAAGVHFSTVSLALNGNPRIPVGTRERIRLLAQQLGYTRNPVMQALAARKRGNTVGTEAPTIVFLTNRLDLTEMNQATHMREFVRGARSRAKELGHRFRLVFCGRPNVTRTSLENALGSPANVAVIAGALVTHRRPCPHDLKSYPVVRIDTAYAFEGTFQISNDQFRIVSDCCRHLVEKGYRSLGLCVGRIDEENTNDAFSSAYLAACDHFGLKPIPQFYFEGSETCAEAAPRLQPWLQRHRPEVVLNNWGTIGEFAQAVKKRVPRELAIADLCLSTPDKNVSGMVQNHALVGVKAAEAAAMLLSGRRQGNEQPVLAVRVPGYWNEGASAPTKALP